MMETKKNFFYKLLIISFLYLMSGYIYAQNGPFLRFSLGSGIMKEYNTINETGFTIAAKNHAIGWGINDRYSVSFSEFGALIRKDIGEVYEYINLDAYGAGFSYRNRNDINFYISGAYATVHFSDSWKKQGDYIEDGYAVSFGVDKKWLLSKRISIGVGPLLFYLKTANYTFTDLSLNFWLDFYLFSQR